MSSVNRQAKVKSDAEEIQDFAIRMHSAVDSPTQWDVSGMLSDAAFKVMRLGVILHDADRLIEEVREAAIVVRETSSPTSILAMDVYDRLQKIERKLMEWTGEEPTP